MKREVYDKTYCIPYSNVVISTRNAQNDDIACFVEIITNAGLDPAMILIGITPEKRSCRAIADNGAFVVHFAGKALLRNYDDLSCASEFFLKTTDHVLLEEATYVNAVTLTEFPVSIECIVVDMIKPGTHVLFIAKVEAIYCDEAYLDRAGKIDWKKLR